MCVKRQQTLFPSIQYFFKHRTMRKCTDTTSVMNTDVFSARTRHHKREKPTSYYTGEHARLNLFSLYTGSNLPVFFQCSPKLSLHHRLGWPTVRRPFAEWSLPLFLLFWTSQYGCCIPFSFLLPSAVDWLYLTYAS